MAAYQGQGKFEKRDGASAIIDFGRLTRAKFADDGTIEEKLTAFQDLRSRWALNDFRFEDWQYAVLTLLTPDVRFRTCRDRGLRVRPKTRVTTRSVETPQRGLGGKVDRTLFVLSSI